jgi:hypothetical protein
MVNKLLFHFINIIRDPIKKRYIYAKKNESGQIIKDHDDIKTKDDKGK